MEGIAVAHGIDISTNLSCSNAPWTMELRLLSSLLGGHDGLSIFNTVERYDPLQENWTMVTPMCYRRCRLGITAATGRLFRLVANGHLFLLITKFSIAVFLKIGICAWKWETKRIIRVH